MGGLAKPQAILHSYITTSRPERSIMPVPQPFPSASRLIDEVGCAGGTFPPFTQPSVTTSRSKTCHDPLDEPSSLPWEYFQRFEAKSQELHKLRLLEAKKTQTIDNAEPQHRNIIHNNAKRAEMEAEKNYAIEQVSWSQLPVMAGDDATLLKQLM